MADEGTKNKDLGKWTRELVIHCLEEAFRRNPDAAMFSMSTVSDLPSDCPIEGTHLAGSAERDGRTDRRKKKDRGPVVPALESHQCSG